MPDPTTISVRALAYGGKFVGSHVGFAQIDIYGPDDPTTPLASGLADQGLVAGTDGSGVVSFIMGQPYPWGYPIRADEATEFVAQIALTEPTVLTFVATSVADTRISTSVSRLVLPNVSSTGAAGVVLVLQGLLAGLTAPATGTSIAAGTPTTITAQVRMMCGCLIDNLFWPAGNFNVQAVITDGGGNASVLPLSYTGNPSYFSADYTFPEAGVYQIGVTATEMNGNCGSAPPATFEVR
ncbi:MAG TPA: hypothetical protein VGO50_06665 [Pyrinomonadaceae bacterium]|jgi:hypothetical protein|nr:hypothetical protein [Pyrinomonadaceae bacterium]